MIFIAGTMTINPAVIEDFQKDIAAMLNNVRAEDGCHHYSLLVEDAASGLVNVLEMWENDDALAAHFQQPWIVDFFAKYSSQMQDSTLQIYDIAGARPLPL